MITTTEKTMKIAIVGAGPGGLMLASLLKKFKFTDVTLYESDPSPSYRSQGGSLDLHRETGQYAMKLAGLHDKFMEKSRLEGDGMKLVDQTGKVLINHESSGEDTYNPEIDRTDLRKILLDSVPPEIIQWNHKLAKVTKEEGSHTLYFQNGKEIKCELVVGADGAWSKVRKYITPQLPEYSGISMVDMVIKDFDNTPLTATYKDGLMFCPYNNKLIVVQRNGYGIVRVYAGMRVEESWQNETPIAKGINPKQGTLEYFDGWDESLRDFIKYADEESMVVRSIYQMPVDLDYKFQDGVVLIGDAAHLMSPFAGEGVNMAFMDAARLAEELCKDVGLDTALDRYYKDMKARVKPAMAQSLSNLNRFVCDEAPQSALAALSPSWNQILQRLFVNILGKVKLL
ncbi:hypothetical protein HDV01_003738 [Terramyces sp. JEL0728]|nr:hypothetical protein HDV01_003738 [Terramyces sp. JEL0728]